MANKKQLAYKDTYVKIQIILLIINYHSVTNTYLTLNNSSLKTFRTFQKNIYAHR